jgi:hypothetical protein
MLLNLAERAFERLLGPERNVYFRQDLAQGGEYFSDNAAIMDLLEQRMEEWRDEVMGMEG